MAETTQRTATATAPTHKENVSNDICKDTETTPEIKENGQKSKSKWAVEYTEFDTFFDSRTGCKTFGTTGTIRNESFWEFAERLKEPIRTHETTKQFQEWGRLMKNAPTTKERKDAAMKRADVKNIGGFVGGASINGKRGKGLFPKRKLLTLDADNACDKFLDLFRYAVPNTAAVVYSTHSYTKEKPRFRIVVLLDRDVTPDEYVRISNHIMFLVDPDHIYFDDTCNQPERLMFWPSVSKDGPFYFDVVNGEPFDVDRALDNCNEDDKIIQNDRNSINADQKRISYERIQVGEPQKKDGWIGAWCAVHSLPEVLNSTLSDYYEPTDRPDRYTWRKGSAPFGLVLYDDFTLAFANDATDPARDGHCKNSFDLCRIHLFGPYDPENTNKIDITKLPSYEKMIEYCRNDELTNVEMRRRAINVDFKGIEAATDDNNSKPDDWLARLEIDDKGRIKSTAPNVESIFLYDPNIAGHVKHDDFSDADIITDRVTWRSPNNENDRYWTDADDAALRNYIEKSYHISNAQKISDGKASALMDPKAHFHPIKDRIKAVIWDKKQRVDKLLIDYLGAADTQTNREFTRKTFVAAVARLFDAGCKYDYVLTLIGTQGIGKSTFVRKMALGYVNDHFRFVSGADVKANAEQLRKIWIAEIGELQGYNKTDSNDIKAFISSVDDFYRDPYCRIPRSHPRKSIFIATTNEENFLKDVTGDRRWWPVKVGVSIPVKNVWNDLDDDTIMQIWGEAFRLYTDGEPLYLSQESEQAAKELQTQHSEAQAVEWRGMIIEFLETLLPVDWNDRGIDKRCLWLDMNRERGNDTSGYCDLIGTVRRTIVCVAEIACECLRIKRDQLKMFSKQIRAVMKTIPEWNECDTARRIQNYGPQRFWERPANGSENVTDNNSVTENSQNNDGELLF